MPTDRLKSRLFGVARRVRHGLYGRAVASEDRWLVSEGGWKLFARLHRPEDARGAVPAVLIIPGLGAPGRVFEGWREPVNVTELVELGCAVMTLDLAGRGRSWGAESYGGPEHQGDVRAALRELAGLRGVDRTRLGVLSFSLGCAATAGALAQGERPAVAWWIDWEGPSDREIITAGGRMMDPALGHGLDDDRYWWPREAVRWVGRTGVPYLRYQSIVDHAQPGEIRHAERMIRAAADGTLPWFQLNDHARNEVPARPQWMAAGLRPARDWILGRVRVLHGLP